MNGIINSLKKVNEKLTKIIEKKYKIFFLIILLFAIFLNTYKFGKIPLNIQWDEAAEGYDSYCLANYGVDRYLVGFPIYFINYGSGQNALYNYFATIFIKIFGISIITLRLPELILSLIEIIVCYKMVSKYKSKKAGLLFMFLVTIMPWHIIKSRWALESNLLSAMFTISVYSLIQAIDKKKFKYYILSGILFGLTLYTYAISYIVIPIFLLGMLIYCLKKKLINLKQIVVFSIPLFILAIPLVYMILVEKGIFAPIYTKYFSIPKFDYRGKEISILNIKYGWKSILRVFVTGDMLGYNSVQGIGPLYLFGFIFVLIGICKTLKDIFINEKNNKTIYLESIMIVWFISNLITVFICQDVNVNKANGIYISTIFFILKGIELIYKNNKFLIYIIIIIYIMAFSQFIYYYFTIYPSQKSACSDNGNYELIGYLEKYKDKTIYINSSTRILYIYELLELKISPYEFNQNKNETRDYNVRNYKNNQEININDLDNQAVYVCDSYYINQYKDVFLNKGYEMEVFETEFQNFYIFSKCNY